jgi:hypothetical protein
MLINCDLLKVLDRDVLNGVEVFTPCHAFGVKKPLTVKLQA